MKNVKILEAKVPETLWFHGSKFDTADELKINPPSPENIFFVAKNLMYSKHYADENQHNKRNTSIYVCTLKNEQTGLKVFTEFGESGKKTKEEFGARCVSYSLRFAGEYLRNTRDILANIIAFISSYCKPIIECGYDKNEISKQYSFRNIKDWGIQEFLDELPNFLDKTGLSEKDILTKNNVENGIAVREAYCKFWKKIGLNAFNTFETQPTGMSDCLGIFDVSALDEIYAIAIPFDVFKKYSTAGDKAIKEFLKNYNPKNF